MHVYLRTIQYSFFFLFHTQQAVVVCITIINFGLSCNILDTNEKKKYTYTYIFVRETTAVTKSFPGHWFC